MSTHDTPSGALPESIPATPAPRASPAPERRDLSPEVEAEIEAAMAELELAGGPAVARGRSGGARGGVAAAPARVRGPRVVEAGREHRKGRIVSVGPTDVFVEFGPKELGVIDRTQFKDDASLPKVGEEFEVIITRYEAQESIYVCVLPGAVQKADWELLEIGQVVEARVTGVNKGGLELELAGKRAFMPASQIALERIEDLSVMVGEKLTCQVARIDRAGKGNIVLSRRDLMREERKERAAKLRESLKEGDVLEGVVKKIMPFGAFVDVGGLDGLVHASDLSHDRVGMGEKAIERHVKPGERVRVQVLKVDWENNKISLGIKQLKDDPFQVSASELSEGAVVTGRITKLAEFGAFVEVAPGVEGLVHISELDWRRVGRVEDVVKPDEVVQVKVLKLDPRERKVSLSIKQAKERPEEPARPGDRAPEAPRKQPKGIKPRDRDDRGAVRDSRSPDEILKETPALRRLREKSATKGGGLGSAGGLGLGLGDLKL